MNLISTMPAGELRTLVQTHLKRGQAKRRQQRSIEMLPEKHLMRLYNKRSRQWGENFLKRNWWRIEAMYDREDISQEAFRLFLRTYRHFPDRPEPDLFRVYKCAMYGILNTKSRQCFPNSFAYVEGLGKLVVDMEDTLSLSATSNDVNNLWSIVSQLPKELADVLKLLIRDFEGALCIGQRRTKKLSGKTRTEPFNVALARSLGGDLSRDLLSELGTAVVALSSAEPSTED